ncbi:MAG: hypothetical protein PUE49_08405 [Eggerthellales bacterium]|nr:hypothetical protein [Eggerthellales bacterium]
MTERKFGDVQIKATPVYTDEDRERILGKGLSDDFKRYYANLGEELKPAAVVGLAQNPNADPEVLGLLFEESWKTEFSEIDRLRQALAMSFNTEDDRDMDFAILRCLASNPATPEFALQRLAGDETFGVWVADNPGVSDDVLEIVVANDCLYEENLPVSLDPARSPEFLRRAVEYGCTDFLPNPSMPGEVLREFSKHEDADVRCLVAKNGRGVRTFFRAYQAASPRLLLNCIGLSHPSDSFSLLSL